MRPIVITLPADELELRDEIMEQLEPYAYVSEPAPSMLGPEEIKLIIEIVMEGAGFLANVAGVAGFLLALKQKSGKDVKAKRLGDSAPPGPLADMSDDEIRELSGESEGVVTTSVVILYEIAQ